MTRDFAIVFVNRGPDAHAFVGPVGGLLGLFGHLGLLGLLGHLGLLDGVVGGLDGDLHRTFMYIPCLKRCIGGQAKKKTCGRRTLLLRRVMRTFWCFGVLLRLSPLMSPLMSPLIPFQASHIRDIGNFLPKTFGGVRGFETCIS